MPSLYDFWTPIYNAFDPWEALQGEKLQRYFVEREESPLDKLSAELKATQRPLKVLVTGHRGSGKSSELAKLAETMAPDFFVVWLDVEKNTDIFSVNHIEVLFLLGLAIYKTAESGGKRPQARLLQMLVDSLTTLIREKTGQADLGVDLGQLLKGVRFSLGIDEKTVGRIEVEPRVTEIVARVNAIIADVESKAGRPLLAIVDGLDKVELEQARRIFARSQVLDQPACHVIYATPIVLYYSPEFSQARNLFATREFPNVKLHEAGQHDRPYEPGYKTMRQVVERRITALGLTLDEFIDTQALNLLVAMSGGVMRELVALVREAGLEAKAAGQRRLDLPAAQKAVYTFRRRYAAGLSDYHYAEMEKVLKTGRRSGTTVEVGGRKVVVCDELLQNLYLLSYANDEFWIDIHPNVRPLLSGVGGHEGG